MFRTRKQSTTSYPLSVLMVSSTDHSTPQTGKTVTCALSKNGGAFASSAGSVSEVSAGVYTLAGNATDRNTLGSLVAKFSATGCDDAFVELEIVPYDVFSVVEANVTQIAGATAAVSGSGSVTFLRGQTVANGSNFPTGFSLLQLESVEGVYYIFDNPNGFSLTTSALTNIGNQVLTSLGTYGDLDTQLDAILAVSEAGGSQGSTVTVYTAASYAGSTPDNPTLPVTLYKGRNATIGPLTFTDYDGDLEEGDSLTLRILPKDTYEDTSEPSITALVESTAAVAIADGTLTVTFELTAEDTDALPAGADGSGRTVYKMLAGGVNDEYPVVDRECVVLRYPGAPV